MLAKIPAPILLLLATLGWAGNTVAAKLAVPEMSPMLLIFLRWGAVVLLIGSIAPAQIIASRRAAAGGRIKWLLFMGAAITMFNALFYLAAADTTALNIGIIQSLIPALILLGGFLYYRERFSLRQIAGLLLTVIGGVIVVSRGDWGVLQTFNVNIGDLLMISACVFYAAYTLGLRKRPAVGVYVMMWYIAVAAWLATLPLVLAEWALGALRLPGLVGALLLAYIALVPSFLSQVWFMRGVDLIGTAQAGLYANFVPIFSALLAVLLLAETPHWYHLLSLAAVFAGIKLFR